MPATRHAVLGILALAAGIVLVMFEFSSYRRGGEISWFWIMIAAFMVALGLYDIIDRARHR